MTTTPNQPDREREAREILYGVMSDDPMIEQVRSGHIRLHHVAWDHAIRAMLAFRDADRAGECDWVSVPKVPTEAMVEAGTQAALDEHGDNETVTRAAYAAMINAAPAIPLLDDETVERCAVIVEERAAASVVTKTRVGQMNRAYGTATAIRALKGSTRGLR